MKGINKYSKLFIYILSTVIICSCLSPVFAETYINPGLAWNGADLRTYWIGGSQNYYNLYQNTEAHNREEFTANGVRDLRHFIFNLYNPQFEIDQPMLMFSITGISVYNYTVNNHIPTCYIENGNGQEFKMQILDYKFDEHDNDHAYIYNLGQNGMMLFVPSSYFFIRDTGGYFPDTPFINCQIGRGANSYFCTITNVNVCITYIGAINLNDVNYTSILDSILQSSLSIDTKLDTVINILNNQQASSDATQAENQTTSLHNNIDLIQNNNMTDVNTSITDIMQNPDYNMDNPSIISGATYITAIANNIFTNAGVFSWAFVFPAFIALAAYVMGRVGLIH